MNNYKDIQACKKYNTIQKSAIIRNLPFIISIEEFIPLYKAPCYYCGCSKAQGLDRIDSSIGYLVTNIVPCCHICNSMKMQLYVKDFLLQCNKISKCHINTETGYVAPQIIIDTPIENINHTIKDNEKRLIKESLTRNNGNRSQTADELGIARVSLYRKIKRYSL